MLSFLHSPTLTSIHDHWKNHSLIRETFVGKVMSPFFNKLPRLVITFLPRSKHLLISWLQSPSAVILESKKIKSATVSTVSPSLCHEMMGPDAMILVFCMLTFKPNFALSSFTLVQWLHVVVVQLPSHVWLFVTQWIVTCQSYMSLTISRNLPKFMFNDSRFAP